MDQVMFERKRRRATAIVAAVSLSVVPLAAGVGLLAHRMMAPHVDPSLALFGGYAVGGALVLGLSHAFTEICIPRLVATYMRGKAGEDPATGR